MPNDERDEGLEALVRELQFDSRGDATEDPVAPSPVPAADEAPPVHAPPGTPPTPPED